MDQKQNQQDNPDENYEGGGTYSEADPEFIKLQIDVEKDLDRFTQEVLRGMVEIIDPNKGTKNWVLIAPGEKPPMNELGVRGLLVLMKSAVLKYLNYLVKTDEEINKICLFSYDFDFTYVSKLW